MQKQTKIVRAATVKEIAAQEAVHPATVRRWIAAGRLPAYRFTDSGPWRVKLRDVEHLRNQRERER